MAKAHKAKSTLRVNQAVESPITREQSEELTQTLLLGAISTIAFCRRFFSRRCFQDQFDALSDDFVLYRDFATGNLLPESSIAASQPQSGSQSRNGSRLQILRRGQRPAVDGILNILEDGIFEAIHRGAIQALQLNVSTSKREPQNVVESWTFTFNGSEAKGHGNGQFITMQSPESMQYPDGQRFTIKGTRYEFQLFIREIISICKQLPELPKQRFLNIMLFYTEGCDPRYEASGFRPCDSVQIYPEVSGWQHHTVRSRPVDLGWQHITLKTFGLKPLGPGNAADKTIPSNLEFRTRVYAEDDVEFAEERENIPRGQNRNSQVVNVAKASKANNAAVVKTRRPITRSQNGVTQGSTQGQAVLVDLQLRKMTEANSQPNALEETQPYAPSHTMVAPPKSTDLFRGELPRILQGSIAGRANLTLHNGISGNGAGEESVRCLCGNVDDESYLLRCEACYYWQHACCHGFFDDKDPRIPVAFKCYPCLLGNGETKRLRELKRLAAPRKALKKLLDESHTDEKGLAKYLGLNYKDVAKTMKRLRMEGYLSETPGSHNLGFSQTGLPRYCMVRPGTPKFQAMLQNYFDPARLLDDFVRPGRNSLQLQTPITGSRKMVDKGSKAPPTTVQLHHHGDNGAKRKASQINNADFIPSATTKRLRSSRAEIQDIDIRSTSSASRCSSTESEL